MIPDARTRRVLAAYPDARSRAHALARVLTCPVEPVLEALPSSGRLLEVGCGHGLFSLLSAERSPALDVVGVDIDADKIAVARRATESLGLADRVDLRATDGSLPDGPFDAVLCVDVLYLLGPERGAALLERMADAITDRGIVVVKEMSDRPAWKSRWNHLQEVGATRVFGYTEGDELEVLAPGQITTPLRGAGLRVTERRLDRWYPHPHLLVTAHAVG